LSGTGGGDDPNELLADDVAMSLEMELLAEVTRLAWEEAKERRKSL
jgi:hypothetical protein